MINKTSLLTYYCPVYVADYTETLNVYLFSAFVFKHAIIIIMQLIKMICKVSP